MLNLLILILFKICIAQSINYLEPTYQQTASKSQANLSGKIKLIDLLNTWAKLNKINLITKDIANTELTIQNQSKWQQLIPQLSQTFNFKLKNNNIVWTATPNYQINYYKNHYIDKNTIATFAHHIKAICKTCLITSNNNHIWIKSPPEWSQIIIQHLQQIDQKPKSIMIRVKLIKANTNWLSQWGQSWQEQHPQTSWIQAILTQTNQLILNHNIMQQQALLHLLASIKTSHQGNLITAANLTTDNNQPTFVEAGIIVPYQQKDSRNRTQTIFKPITLKLSITPIITDKKTIKLITELNYNHLNADSTNINNQPIETSRIINTVSIKNRQTIVSSHLNTNTQTNYKQTNLLSNLPIIGKILQHSKQQQQQQTMLLFISAEFN